MRTLVCGGRFYEDEARVFDVLDLLGPTLVIHGCAKGADSLAAAWARKRGVALAPYPANWNVYGKAAGHKRNQLMLDEAKPDLVVAFPGGAGTADMTRRAEAAGVGVVRIG